MPTYDYQCPNCLRVEVKEHSIKDTPAYTCAKCGRDLRRQISGGTHFSLKGSCWAKDGYR